jgi:hypothetical protein
LYSLNANKATLTINGSLSALSGAYNINVARDALGRVTEKNEGIDEVFVKQTYGYDVAGRLYCKYQCSN